jgi:membrane protein implicated in regulation of membrane protease activity
VSEQEGTEPLRLDPEGFKEEVRKELRAEEEFLDQVQRPLPNAWKGHMVAVVLLAVSAVMILLDPHVIYIWALVALLLYSYNFLILLLPTTSNKRPSEFNDFVWMGWREKMDLLVNFARKKLLAAEVGLTLFLGGMVPLAISFGIIFGLGLFFTLYNMEFTSAIDWNSGILIIVQVALILAFLRLVFVIHPESQGFRRLAASMRDRYGQAREQGGWAKFATMALIIASIIGCAALAFGGILLPGTTLAILWSSAAGAVQADLVALPVVVVIQLYVMRHFQSVVSRDMAIRTLKKRNQSLMENVLRPMERLAEEAIIGSEHFEREFARIRHAYFSQAIYCIVNADLFGRAPVYLVGVRFRYILDRQVLDLFKT